MTTDPAATSPALDALRFCPDCGKATINWNDIAGSASCNSCPWQGSIKDLLSQPVAAEEANNLSTLARQDFVRDVVGAFTPAVMRWLLKWGFVFAGKHLRADSLRIIKAGSNAFYEAVLKERQAIASEQQQ